MRKLICVLLSSAFLILAACGTNEAQTTESKIQDVLELLFTCPDEEQKNLIKNFVADVSPETHGSGKGVKEYTEYLTNHYPVEAFTEDCFQGLAQQILGSMMFPTLCVVNEFQISPEEISVDLLAEQDLVYEFTAKLKVTNGKTSEIVEVGGRIQTDENDRISSIKPELGKLLDVIM